MPVQNYEVLPGTLFEDFETGFTGGGTTGSIANDTVNFKTGTMGLKVTSTNGGYYGTKVISQSGSAMGVIGYWVYIPDITNLFAITVYISSSTTFASTFSYQTLKARLVNGWNFITIPRASWTNTGSESWENTMVRFRARVDTIASQTCEATFDSLYTGIYGRPKVLINFDDNWDSAFTEGYGYMNPKGLKGTIFVISSLVDTANRMTLSNLKTVYANGWDIGNHTATHQNLSTLSEPDIRTEISTCKKYLDGNGFVRASDHLAYPNGGFNTTSLNVVDSMGVKLGYDVVNSPQPHVKGLPSKNLVHRYSILNTDTLNGIKALVDFAIASGTTVILNFHKLVTSSSASTEWNIADFRSLIDYIEKFHAGGVLDVVTASEWEKNQ